MASFQSLIDVARYTLNDDAKDRYPDAECLLYANKMLGVIKRLRPDLWFGRYGVPLPTYALADTYPLSPEYEQPMIDLIVARAEAKNSEFGEDARVAAFFGLAKSVVGA